MRAGAVLMAFLMPLGGPAAMRAQAPVRPQPAVLAGQVLDDATGLPLSGVLVSIAGAPDDVASDARGLFTITLGRPMRLALGLRLLGYHPMAQLVDVEPRDTTRVTFFLVRITQVLDTMRVQATATTRSLRLQGFERRREQHVSGQFVSREEIRKRGAMRASQLLLNRAGVRMIEWQGVMRPVSSRGDRLSNEQGIVNLLPCFMLIAVDGVLKEQGFAVDQIPPEEIHGIEIYSGPGSVPIEFSALQRDAYCGLVAFWTRLDR